MNNKYDVENVEVQEEVEITEEEMKSVVGGNGYYTMGQADPIHGCNDFHAH